MNSGENGHVFPALVVQPKWHVGRRNVTVGDIVLIEDSNTVRGEWRLGIVSKVMPSKDDRVRQVKVTYKKNTTRISVLRAVQRLIVLVPKEQVQHNQGNGHHST